MVTMVVAVVATGAAIAAPAKEPEEKNGAHTHTNTYTI